MFILIYLKKEKDWEKNVHVKVEIDSKPNEMMRVISVRLRLYGLWVLKVMGSRVSWRIYGPVLCNDTQLLPICAWPVGSFCFFQFLEWFKKMKKKGVCVAFLFFLNSCWFSSGGISNKLRIYLLPIKTRKKKRVQRSKWKKRTAVGAISKFDLNFFYFHVYFVVCSILGPLLLSCSSIWASKSSGIQHDSLAHMGGLWEASACLRGTKQHGQRRNGKEGGRSLATHQETDGQNERGNVRAAH